MGGVDDALRSRDGAFPQPFPAAARRAVKRVHFGVTQEKGVPGKIRRMVDEQLAVNLGVAEMPPGQAHPGMLVLFLRGDEHIAVRNIDAQRLRRGKDLILPLREEGGIGGEIKEDVRTAHGFIALSLGGILRHGDHPVGGVFKRRQGFLKGGKGGGVAVGQIPGQDDDGLEALVLFKQLVQFSAGPHGGGIQNEGDADLVLFLQGQKVEPLQRFPRRFPGGVVSQTQVIHVQPGKAAGDRLGLAGFQGALDPPGTPSVPQGDQFFLNRSDHIRFPSERR